MGSDTHSQILRVTVDSKSKFDKHINELRKKCNQKLHAFDKYMSTDKRRILFKVFVVSSSTIAL